MKNKWWVVPLVLVLIAAVVLFSFWDAIAIRVAPKMVLSKALTNTVSALEARLVGSPITVLAGGVDKSGRNTIDLQLDTVNALLGDVCYNMTVQTEGAPRRIYAEGTVQSKDSTLDLSVYLDGDFAAVSSQSLLGGNFYGITYETFPQDIHSMPLLAYMIGEKTIGQWEATVSELQETMAKTYEMPQFSEEDLQAMLAGVLALKAEVSRDTLTWNGQERAVHRVTFTATGPEIAAAAENFMEGLSAELQELVGRLQSDPNSALNTSFFIYEDVVAKFFCDLTVQDERLQLELLLGEDAARDDLDIALIHQTEDSLEKWSVGVSTEYDEASYGETLTVLRIVDGIQDSTVMDYDWDIASGDMLLNLEDNTVRLNLQATETGFRLSTDQFETLMSAFGDEKKIGNSACIMTVAKGASITTPEYKNFDQWSGDDLLTLLGGLGSLFGLQIG